MGKSLHLLFLFLPFFLVSISAFFLVSIGADQPECSTDSKCSNHGPAIRFPFRLKGRQPPHCGYPGFDLYCDEKQQTVLELPSSVKLLVDKIDYKFQKIQVYDEKNCFANLLRPLNFSSTPFQFEWVNDYALFNCSPANTERTGLVNCLSLHGYHVLAVPNDYYIIGYRELSCSKIYNNLSVPFDVFRNKYVRLLWSKSICGDCEAKSLKCGLMKNSTIPKTQCFGKLKSGGKPTWAVVTGVIVGFFLVVGVIFLIYRRYSSNRMEKENQAKIEKFLEDYRVLKPTRYSYADIKRITNRLEERLGEGGYGTVFKGKLSNEILVAVKILNNFKGNGEEFTNEVGTMATIHHVNVVRLVGYCADRNKRALVYEFLPNESLEKFIYKKQRSLSWVKLQDIAIGIAKGIEYLHQGCDQQILHFDIKPHNILLDHNFNPKISDFGLAKLCSKEQSAVSMTTARGTMGYIAPEVLSRNFGNVSHKSDVYSFGMVLLEMVGGRKNIDDRVDDGSQIYFPEWIYNRLDRGEELRIQIEEEGDAKIAKKLAIVGLWCIQWCPVDRPPMKVVVQMLEGGENLTMPPNPFTSAIQTKLSATTPERPFSKELAAISESERLLKEGQVLV